MKRMSLPIAGVLAIITAECQFPGYAAEPTPYTAAIFAGNPGTEEDPGAGSGSADGFGQDARFNGPDGLALDADGNLYVTDTENHTIRKITPAGQVSTLAGLPGERGFVDGTGTNARFRWPRDIVMHPDGDLRVQDEAMYLRAVTMQGAVTTPTNWFEMTGPIQSHRIAYDGEGRFYAVFPFWRNEHGGIQGPGRSPAVGYLDGPFSESKFWGPSGMGVGPEGDIYVAEPINACIRKISLDLQVTTVAGQPTDEAPQGRPNRGSNDGPVSEAMFLAPLDVALDTQGNIFVLDDRAVRKIGIDGLVTTILTPGLRKTTVVAPPPFWPISPKRAFGAIVVDQNGRVFVSDPVSNTILVLTPVLQTPALQLSIEGGRVVLSWPASDGDFVLESTTDLGNQDSWTEVTNPLTGLQNRVMFTTEPSASARFWRLRSR